MAFFRRATVKAVVVILGSILAFNSLPKFQFVAPYFEKYPYIIFALAVVLITYSGKIAEKFGD